MSDESLGRRRRAARRSLAASLVDAVTVQIGEVVIRVPRWVFEIRRTR